MNTFTAEVEFQNGTRTDNGMKALANPSVGTDSTLAANVELFYNIGAMRGQDCIPLFEKAYLENREVALRVILWARDIRGGAGERQHFRNVLQYLEAKDDNSDAVRLLHRAPELGRWDDVLVVGSPYLQLVATLMIRDALATGDALCAKWMPRKGAVAARLRAALKMSPKVYRKTLVELTKVVETQMCANEWDEIEFSHVPSKASKLYSQAFTRHCTTYKDYLAKLASGDKSVKVNAAAIYPHEVLNGILDEDDIIREDISPLIQAQWDALPNYLGESSVLPMIDTSGSMGTWIGDTRFSCMRVAIALGLYVADKNKGAFADMYLTFSEAPELKVTRGSILEKVDTVMRSDWGYNTNLHAAFNTILETAKRADAPQSDMPQTLLIFSDMQFDQCVQFDDSAMQMIKRKYEEAGYVTPKIVFWNLDSHNNVPVSANEVGAALVSGFSPSLLKSVLGNSLEDFTPTNIMLETVMGERYKT